MKIDRDNPINTKLFKLKSGDFFLKNNDIFILLGSVSINNKSYYLLQKDNITSKDFFLQYSSENVKK